MAFKDVGYSLVNQLRVIQKFGVCPEDGRFGRSGAFLDFLVKLFQLGLGCGDGSMQFLLFCLGVLGCHFDHNLAVPVLADGADRQARRGCDARYPFANGFWNPAMRWAGGLYGGSGFFHISQAALNSLF